MPDFILTEQENNALLEASMGDVITIRLSENSTTGYAWQWEDFPEHFLVLDSSDLLLPGELEVGGGGIRQFRLHVQSKGRATVHIVLRRTWEKGKSPAKEFVFTVTVK